MPFGKITKSLLRKGRRPRRRNFASKTYVHKALARNIENKVQQSAISATFGSLSNVWTELVLCAPAQGVAINQRIGRRIKIKSLEIKGVILGGTAESALDDPFNVVRIVIGIYNPVSTTPLTGIASLGTPITRTHFTDGRMIRKYLDKFMSFSVSSTEKGGGDGYTPTLKNFVYYKRFRNLTIFYGDDTINQPSKRLILSMLSDSALPPHAGFVAGYIKVTYEDA